MSLTDSTRQSLLSALRSAVGISNVLTEGDLSAWEEDWRHRMRGKALAVVRPSKTEEVAAVVKACFDAGVSIVPQGGNTGLVAGATPDSSGMQVVLSLTRMQAVRSIDTANLTITVEAGCVLQKLQETVESAGYLFPLSMAAEGSCTIGGNLATNAGGTQVLRYGNARELCLGVEVVTATGEVWNGLSGLRKDNTGYDLRDLFIGSEGTLGIITAATLKLFPQPASRLTAWVAVPGLPEAVKLLGLAQGALGSGLTGFEVMGQFALSLVNKHMPNLRVPFAGSEVASYCVLLENADSDDEARARSRVESLLEGALEEGCVVDAVIAENLSQTNQLWHVRESIPLAQAQEGPNIKHDVSLAVSKIAAFVEITDSSLRTEIPGIRLVNFGHLGDGNLHYNVQAPLEDGEQHFIRDQERRINDIVYRSVAAFDGSFSAEHGIGALKRHDLQEYESPVALRMMLAIKNALDPQNLMNPGCMLRR